MHSHRKFKFELIFGPGGAAQKMQKIQLLFQETAPNPRAPLPEPGAACGRRLSLSLSLSL